VIGPIKFTAHDQILELGAGICWLSALLAQKSQQVIAFDISRVKYQGLETAEIIFKYLPKIFFERILGNMQALPFKNNSFDYVIVSASLHHADDLATTFARN